MVKGDRAILGLLKEQLTLLEQGDYGRRISAPLPDSAFQESPACIHATDSAGAVPCSECHLIDFVAHDHRCEMLPCRFIALNDAGETIEHLEAQGNQAKLDAALKEWLRAKIKQIEDQGTKAEPNARKASTGWC